ncbi:MAG TPA: amino acid adenylation domain-containing protein [Planctomycetota bacterium]|nr:amino acid adenylation domain-containing protein [Planctomycetota bacterium]
MAKTSAPRQQMLIKHDPERQLYPLSFAQNRLWFLDQYEPGSVLFNVPQATRLRGKLNILALQNALDALAARHSVLRTTFVSVDGVPQQRVLRDVHVPLTQSGLPHVNAEERERELLRQLNAEARRPFSLSKDLLFRAHLIRIDARDHALLLTLHHIISDGWSLGILNHELSVFYNAFAAGVQPDRPALPLQFCDFALWQESWMNGGGLEGELSYWKERLSGELPLLELPVSKPRAALQTYNCAIATETFRGGKALKNFCEREGVTLYMALLAAFHAVLHRYTSSTDILTGSPVAGRHRSETEPLIGLFVNILVFRGDLSGNPTFRELLKRTRDLTLGAFAHANAPFEKLVEVLQVPRSQSHSPVVQVLFALQNTPLETLKLDELTATPVRLPETAAKYDITLSVRESLDGLDLTLDYNTDLYEHDAMERLLQHYVMFLQNALLDPDVRVESIPLLNPAEKKLLLETWNQSKTEIPAGACVQELVEAQVRRTPDAIAVRFGSEALTYSQLNARANQLARQLQAKGVKSGSLIAVCVERSLDMLTAVLATVKAGAAYLPLDPEHPGERLAYILDDANVALLLTHSHVLAKLPATSAATCVIDTERQAFSRLPAHDLELKFSNRNLAYVIYTSGSTGKPKGAGIDHRAVVNLFTSLREKPGITSSDILLATTTLSFDIATLEMFLPLTVGACIHIVPREVAIDARKLADALESSDATIMQATPATWRMLTGSGWQPSRRIKMFCGGEALSPELAGQLLKRSTALWNMYGPTETAIYSVIHKVESVSRNIAIGRPVANTRLYLLDQAMQPVPLGVNGELYIGGFGLAHGYLRRPRMTAERFVPDPFSTEPGARLYRTGDLARYRSDGNIEYLGRIDHQVKIRGFRIELGEIEAALTQHSAIRSSVVVARTDASGEPQLAAYVVAREGSVIPPASELRTFLSRTLPAYMVPAFFIVMEALPISPNGKVDRKALPVPDSSSLRAQAPLTPARNETEQALVEIWQSVLRVDRVGVFDNFFELGGHSLIATQVVSRIRDQLKAELSIKDFFADPTIAALALRIGGQATPAALSPIPRQSASGAAPLSAAQQRLWFLEQLEPLTPLYNVPFALRIKGELDTAALYKCLNALVQRHAALRTRFISENGVPAQLVLDSAELVVAETYLYHVPQLEREHELQRLLADEAHRPFDLTADLLIRATRYEIDKTDHALLIVMHHIVCDAWSISILKHELSAFYEHFAFGATLQLPELPIQYSDYAIWQREQNIEAQLEYWKKKLAPPLSVLELPIARARPKIRTNQGAWSRHVLGHELSQAAAALCEREKLTPFMLFLGVFQMLLQRYSAQNDIVVGTPIAGRNRLETEKLVGFFVNTLVIRSDLSGKATFRELLERVRETSLEAFAHQDVPFEKLVEELASARDRSHTPLFQVMYMYQQSPGENCPLSNLSVSPISLASRTAKFDMMLVVKNTPAGFETAIEYNTSLFDAAVIDRLQEHFELLLSEMTRDVNQLAAGASLLTASERKLLASWNRTQTAYPRHASIHELFEAQAELTPQRVALTSSDLSVRYGELNARANQLAHHLIALGVQPEEMIALSMDRSLEMVIAILAILKAGGVYVPLDPAYPAERLNFMLQDTRAAIILTQEKYARSLRERATHVLSVDTLWNQLGGKARTNPDRSVRADNLAYVMYTSGSTGRPKGVCVTHRAVVRLVKNTNFANFGSEQVFLQSAPISFDASTLELWGPLLNGGRLALFAAETSRLDELAQTIEEQQVTTLWLTAGLFHQMVETDLKALASVRQLLAGGDVLSPEHVRKALDHLPDCRLINGYGPTENTTFTCCYTIPHSLPPGMSVPIGTPISNSEVYILDRNLEPVPIGIPGELYIGGDGLARGYLNRPELTADKFVPNPFSCEPGARMYRSGDLARHLPDGAIEFLGRIDNQVKIRGFRIEPGEIECVLTQHPHVREAAVIVREDTPGDKRLAAYYCLQKETTADELRRFLAERLPQHMIPAAFVHLDKLPLNPNGKVDRAALPAPKNVIDGNKPDERPWLPLQIQLAEIWEKMLGVKGIGVRDNFFELGGHSLLAVRMISQVEQTCGRRIPLAALFADPTIAGVAEALLSAAPDDEQSLLEVQAGNGGTPLFYLDGDLLGGGFYCRKLASHLGSAQRFYALRPGALKLPLQSIEKRAAENIGQIRALVPHGPYRIGGFCAEALVAYEMARQLRRAGEQVESLVLIDPTTVYRSERAAQRLLKFYAKLAGLSQDQKYRRLKRWIGRVSRLRRWVSGNADNEGDVLLKMTQHALAQSLHVLRAKNPHVDGGQGDVLGAHLWAACDYAPGAYDGRVTLILSGEIARRSPEITSTWARRTTDLQSSVIQGEHLEIVTRNVAQLAAAMQRAFPTNVIESTSRG